MLYFAPLWIAKFQLWGIHSCVRVTLFPAGGIESHLVPSSFRRRGDRFGESSSCQEKKPAPVTWDVIKLRRKTDRDTSLSLSPLIPLLFLHSIPQSLFLSSSFHLSTFLCSSSLPPGPSVSSLLEALSLFPYLTSVFLCPSQSPVLPVIPSQTDRLSLSHSVASFSLLWFHSFN